MALCFLLFFGTHNLWFLALTDFEPNQNLACLFIGALAGYSIHASKLMLHRLMPRLPKPRIEVLDLDLNPY